MTLPNIRWALLYGVLLCNARAMGEFGAVSVVSGHIRGLTNTMPLHIEILYNEYNFVAAFAVATLLAGLALLTLVAKSLLEWRYAGELAARIATEPEDAMSVAVTVEELDKELRPLSGAGAACRSTSRRASWSPCWALRARARPRCCAPSRASNRPTAGRSSSATSMPTSSSLRERRIGFVFQHYALFRHMTVMDNIAFGLRARPRKTRPSGQAIRDG